MKPNDEEFNSETVQMPIRVPCDLHFKFKMAVISEKKSMQNVVVDFIKDYLQKFENRKSKD